MGMISTLYRLPSEGFEELIRHADEIYKIISGVTEDFLETEKQGKILDLDKFWHALDNMLTDDPTFYSGRPPASWAIQGDKAIGFEDFIVSYLFSEQVLEVSKFLKEIDINEFQKKFNAKIFDEKKIYIGLTY